MKKFLTLFLVCITAGSAFAQEKPQKFKGWKKSSTEHFNFVYEDSAKEDAQAYAEIADDAWNKIGQVYSFPKDVIDVYVTDRTNTVNAFTMNIGPEIEMFTTELTEPLFGFRDDWRKLFFTHELVHAANWTFEDKSYLETKLFGPAAKNFTTASIPGWALEGLTTVLETELTDGGRGRSPYFELMFKAPTLENGFLAYSEIGLESKPPANQIYVMGYVIMRSIADRWGLQALADIERNRSLGTSWEDSIEYVTGETAKAIFNDARISLLKRYNKERNIPEGKTISPRYDFTNYMRPAIIIPQGLNGNKKETIVTLRSNYNSSAVIAFTPSAINGSDSYAAGSGETYTETVLFEGNFFDELSVCADENLTVYASLASSKNTKLPGTSTDYFLYKWTEKKGLKKLSSVTLTSPAVSRDGKVLAACQKYGLKTRIVLVDTETGNTSSLFADRNLSFINPALNADGSKITFLVLDGTRARIAVADIENGKADGYRIIANDSEDGSQIFDPAYLSWNLAGNITFAANIRGRLEAYETTETNGKYTYEPKVSDPIGVLWADKTETCVYYGSYSSTGYVVKAKPLDEWGKVPADNGPSPCGEIIHIGNLAEDYKNFNPFNKERENFKLREEKYKEMAEQSREGYLPVKTELEKEHLYIPFPKPVFWMPLYSILSSGNDDSLINSGFGGLVVWKAPPRQNKMSDMAITDFLYFPDLNDYKALAIATLNPGNSELFIVYDRSIRNTNNASEGKYELTKEHTALASVNLPLHNNYFYDRSCEINFDLAAYYQNISRDNQTMQNDITANFGIETSFANSPARGRYMKYSAQTLGVAYYNFDYPKIFMGFEGCGNISYLGTMFSANANVRGRYTNFPAETTLKYSLSNLTGSSSGRYIDCSYPGRLILNGSLGLRGLIFGNDLNFFTEALASFGKNTATPEKSASNAGAFELSQDITLGLEMTGNFGHNYIKAGYAWTYGNSFTDGELYFIFKINSISF